ncbi:cytoskeletal protein binding protein [Kappamyces sp. JEL0829]|nr:cytoskeletal protein binding protein [Kappamyces sp. JEL0829]
MKCKMVARALYDYDAQEEGELSIREGGILLITDDTDQDWWEAYQRPLETFEEGKKGLVPLTYVEEATPVCIVTALYDYDPNAEEEIAIREGDLIRIYEKVDSDWWFGKHDHDVGLIPATYVEEDPGMAPAPVPVSIQQPAALKTPTPSEPVNAEAQKNMLLNALGGLGFETRKSENKVTGIIYGPDDATYYPVTELDKKKKKNSVKGFLGVSQIDKMVFFVRDNSSKEILSSFATTEIKKYHTKKKNLTFDMDNGDTKEFEGDKKDIEALGVHIEAALRAKVASPVLRAGSPAAVSSPVPVLPVASPISQSKVAIALYDYTPAEQGELEIKENDMLVVLDSSDPDWWLVKHLKKSGEGLVPMTYVELQTPGVKKPLDQAAEQSAQRQRELEEQRRREEQDRQNRAAEDRRAREEMERRRAEEERARIASPVRPKVETPVIPTRPQVPSAPQIPAVPSRPPVAVAAPSLPNRPPVAAERPNIPARPTVPASRPKTENLVPKAADLPEKSKVRDWKDKTGKFTVEAAYIGISENKVQLHKTNGVIIGVPLDKLDDAALSYLKSIPGNENIDIGPKQTAPAPPQMRAGSVNNLAERAVDNANYTHNGFDWKDWLIKAGIASSDASSYAKKFVAQRLDSSILADIDRDALRAMGITEGDIIRIRKAANLPAMTQASRAKASQNEMAAHARNMELINGKSRNSQIASDEAYARQLQNEELGRASAAGKSANYINPTALFEAGNLLQQANTPAVSHKATPSTASVFSKPPSTQEAATSLGLSGVRASSFSNDPWGSSSASPAPSQDAVLIAKQRQETQKALETAQLVIQKANEQARQAALLEEQAKLKQQTEMNLAQAQETAKQALFLQQQAAQKLMAAKMESSKMAMPMQQQGFGATPAHMNQQQFVPRPFTAPLIPTPTGPGSNTFIPTGSGPRPPNQFNGMQGQGVQTFVSANGVPKPNWNSATPNQPFGNVASLDPYSAFKDVAPNAPSVFNSPPPSIPAQMTGTSNSSFPSSIGTSPLPSGAMGQPNPMLSQSSYSTPSVASQMNRSSQVSMNQGMHPTGMQTSHMQPMNQMGIPRATAVGAPQMNPMGNPQMSQMGNPQMNQMGMNPQMNQMGMNPQMNQMGMNPQVNQMGMNTQLNSGMNYGQNMAGASAMNPMLRPQHSGFGMQNSTNQGFGGPGYMHQQQMSGMQMGTAGPLQGQPGTGFGQPQGGFGAAQGFPQQGYQGGYRQ